MLSNDKLVLALPKGRILEEVMPLVNRAGIKPEEAFNDTSSRKLRFSTNHPNLDIIRVRSFDVATFIAFGAAHFGVAGQDVLMEFDSSEIYTPIDLGIGHCRIMVAEPADISRARCEATITSMHIRENPFIASPEGRLRRDGYIAKLNAREVIEIGSN